MAESRDQSEANLNEGLLSVEDFENLNLPESLQPYKGKGNTSFAEWDKKSDPKNWANYDTEKREYLESIGIVTPEEWLTKDEESGAVRIEKESRALFVTMFIITGHILATESIRRVCGSSEEFQAVLDDRNNQILEHRLDRSGMRRRLTGGSLVESHYEKLELSANPEKRVSIEELSMIKSYLFEQLRKKYSYV